MVKTHLHLPPPADGMHLAKRPTGITMSLVVLLIALTLMGIPSIIADPSLITGSPSFEKMTANFMQREQGLVNLFSFAVALGVLWIWLRAKERRSFSTLGFGRSGQTLRRILRGAGVALGFMLVTVLVPVVFGQATLTWHAPEIGSDGLLFVVLMLLAFIVQGSTEEILLRGYITQAVARRWGLVAAVIVQAVVFAAMHGGNPGMGVVPFINLVFFALFASMWTLAEGSLWGICALHGVWNWAQGNLFGVAVSGNVVNDSLFAYTPNEGSINLITGGAFGIEGSLITSALLLAGAALAWRKFRASRADSPSLTPRETDALPQPR